MTGTAEHMMNNFDYSAGDALTAPETHDEPLLRPFEIVAIGCGVMTLVATFFVSVPLYKGMLIGGSLLGLIGALLHYGAAYFRDRVSEFASYGV